MCTVTYIPVNNGFVLTSNRDEAPHRKTFSPEIWELENAGSIKAPKDGEKGGTWIAVEEEGRAACLLNGAFEKHHRNPPYAMSRGALIPMAFKAESFFHFYENLDPKGMEPFTLILIDSELQVLKWDGQKLQIQYLSRKHPHLWSSATLYSAEEHKQRVAVFEEFLESKKEKSVDQILHLHGVDGKDDFVLRHPEVQTVSITQVVVQGSGVEMNYCQPFEILAE
ncbi:hypothetical protein E7Z59_14350 [Robertkochia marina]|uniref:NRDE family protein n=1 Tax=Robertkochia marina TaxID=1227945 RepID=A0A4S3LX55_9FLAO|nr:NRDE family protein [Robertkochia marina]THD65764.1 hypothetical protein E7Z59_14350 [Robertkochia marina]TRZ46552.1 hypothetical protein D3A96_03000 [Robertkochia marina]